MNHAELMDRWHKSQYDAVRSAHPEHDLPEWEDLPEGKKQKVREANDENQRFFNDLGKAISTGGPLPDPFRDTARRQPSELAQGSMNECTDDTSWVFVQQTGEKWVLSDGDDPVEWTDAKGRGWHWQPDPRPGKKA